MSSVTIDRFEVRVRAGWTFLDRGRAPARVRPAARPILTTRPTAATDAGVSHPAWTENDT
ncbi:hypothetical protein TPA0908_43410 [Micromonospora sp. AKA38]|nr:hypothetical protein TPA0908_43410 [Micromonospora sp. AKA38]